MKALESAREFYSVFAECRLNDVASLADLSAAHRTLGEISWKMGEHDQALQDIQASMDASTAANSSQLLATEYLQAAMRLSSYFSQLGRLDESLEVLNKTLAQADKRRETEPKDVELSNFAN